MSNYTKKQKFVSVVVIPSLIVGMLLTTTSIQAQEVTPPLDSSRPYQKSGFDKPVDFAAINFSENAKFFEGTYVVAEDKLVNAECGGKYMDDECYIRTGVPIPVNVAFNAKDKRGNFTSKGLRPPTAEQMKNLLPDSFPDVPNPNPELTITDTTKGAAVVRPYYGDAYHTSQGFTLPWVYPHAGLYASQSSPNWAMTGGTFPYYFFAPTMFPGDGPLESTMQHNLSNGTVSHQHAYYNHSLLTTPSMPQGFFGWETHNAAWIAKYERPNQGGSSYVEYLYVYIKTGATSPAWKSCTQAVMYNYTAGGWEQKANVCGWTQRAVGDAWNISESVNVHQSAMGGWQCYVHPSVVHMSNQQLYRTSANQWAPIVAANAPIINNIQVPGGCMNWNFGRTYDPGGLMGWITF